MWTRKSVMEAPVKNIETFTRRYVPLLPLSFSFFHVGYVCYILINLLKDEGLNSEDCSIWFILTVVFVLTVHFLFTIALLIAPRFLYKGYVWLKAAPWIISSLTLFFFYYCMTLKGSLNIAYIIVGGVLQVIQFVFCVLPWETPVSFLFKPFEMVLVPNMMAGINFNDPNFALDSIYGPALQVPSTIPGQKPVTIRYGSQAMKIPQYPPSEAPKSYEMSDAPPVYEFVIPTENNGIEGTSNVKSSESSSGSTMFYQNEKTQFSNKK